MRKFFNRVVFIINSVAAAALLLSYLLPYVSPETFPLLSVLSLAVPILIIINVLFLIFWIFQLSKRVLLSFVALALGFSHITSLYKLNGNAISVTSDSVTLMSYNVHSFNRFDWIDSNTIPQDISKLVVNEDPDVLCLQEYYNNPDVDFTQYCHKYEYFNHDNRELALVVFSKYEIVNTGSLDFGNTVNNAIYTDLVIQNDTIRVYNVHLQSHGIQSKADDLSKVNSYKLAKHIGESFKKQQLQAEELIAHMKSSKYRNVVMGDFNNTAYSYIYNQIKSQNLQDGFKIAGRGFGKTFKFELFPARIDFILVPNSCEVQSFKNHDVDLSDHFPIQTRIRL